MAAQRLHAECCNAATIQLWQDLPFETSDEAVIECVQWHLNRIERKSRIQHSQMHHWVLVSGESHKSRLAILLCFGQRLRRSIWPNEELRVILESHSVNLPQIEMVGLQTPQRLFEHLQSQACISPVRTRFRHQKYFVTASLQPSSHPELGLASPVFPAVVVESNSFVDGFLNNADRSLLIGRVAPVMTAKAQIDNFGVSASKLSEGNTCA